MCEIVIVYHNCNGFFTTDLKIENNTPPKCKEYKLLGELDCIQSAFAFFKAVPEKFVCNFQDVFKIFNNFKNCKPNQRTESSNYGHSR